jgi:hypothetical protein
MAIVDDSAARREFDGALLLVGRASDEVAVINDLKLNQAKADEAEPENKTGSEQVQPLSCAIGLNTSRHRFTLDNAAAGNDASRRQKLYQ